MRTNLYTTQLGAGQGIAEETLILLDLWEEGMGASELYQLALKSGRFQQITARRLRNLIFEGFAPRYLSNVNYPAKYLKKLKNIYSRQEFSQLLYIYTCRVHKILYDFIVNIYWNAYSTGRKSLTFEDARNFVLRANQDGKTMSPWSESVVKRVGSYISGTCADFGLLESNSRGIRGILPFRIEPRTAVFLAYDLHFSRNGDNSVLSHPDWGLFGLDRNDVLNEFKRLAPMSWWIIQSAGDATRISWQYSSMEEMINVFSTE